MRWDIPYNICMCNKNYWVCSTKEAFRLLPYLLFTKCQLLFSFSHILYFFLKLFFQTHVLINLPQFTQHTQAIKQHITTTQQVEPNYCHFTVHHIQRDTSYNDMQRMYDFLKNACFALCVSCIAWCSPDSSHHKNKNKNKTKKEKEKKKKIHHRTEKKPNKKKPRPMSCKVCSDWVQTTTGSDKPQFRHWRCIVYSLGPEHHKMFLITSIRILQCVQSPWCLHTRSNIVSRTSVDIWASSTVHSMSS